MTLSLYLIVTLSPLLPVSFFLSFCPSLFLRLSSASQLLHAAFFLMFALCLRLCFHLSGHLSVYVFPGSAALVLLACSCTCFALLMDAYPLFLAYCSCLIVTMLASVRHDTMMNFFDCIQIHYDDTMSMMYVVFGWEAYMTCPQVIVQLFTD